MNYTCTREEALARARSIVNNGGQYLLGTGDYRPKKGVGIPNVDLPWTERDGKLGSDCAGFAICWAWKLTRHRPGFNVGPWATVSDDINCNSALEDGLHKQELFTTLPEGSPPLAGDLLLYPTIRIRRFLRTKVFIGHVGILDAVPMGFRYGDWSNVRVLQCHGPNGYTPGVVRTDGSIWAHHDTIWGKPEHRTRVVRVKERR